MPEQHARLILWVISVVRDAFKYLLGWSLSIFFPQARKAVVDRFTLPGEDGQAADYGLTYRLVRFYLARNAQRDAMKRSPRVLEDMHRHFWSNTQTYFTNSNSRTTTVFIPEYGEIMSEMASLLAEKGIDRLCEFGPGDGLWLDYLSRQWPMVTQCFGIDISASQTTSNSLRYPHLTFVQADLLEWAMHHAGPNTVYHTMGGVLEYLSEESVQALFSQLSANAKNSFLLLCEPLYGDFDFDRDLASEIIGHEFSYSHNYRYLLEKAHAKVLWIEERKIMDHRMVMLLAGIG